MPRSLDVIVAPSGMNMKGELETVSEEAAVAHLKALLISEFA
jgi:hypothetical protein